MNTVSAFLATKTPREKILLAALMATLLVWLGLTQIWQPLHAERQALNARIPRLERALAQTLAAPQTPALQTTTADPRPTPVILTTAAETFGLRISRLQPQGAQVQLAIEDAAFETVLLWIEALERDHALRLIDLALTRRTAAGVVGTTLTVER